MRKPSNDFGMSSKTHDVESEELSSSEEDESEIERELAEVTFEDLQKAKSNGSLTVFKKPGQEKKGGRANKNRPTEVSCKKPVSRFREVVQVPKKVVRDPRFESLCGNLDVEGYVSVAFLYLSVNLLSACFMAGCSCHGFEATLCKRIESSLFRKRYDFLFKNNLPAEKEELKKQLKKSNDPKVIDQLKEHISWIEKQTRFESTKQTDAAILTEHKKKEREAAKQGKRPFYLKKCISTYLSLSVASLLIMVDPMRNSESIQVVESNGSVFDLILSEIRKQRLTEKYNKLKASGKLESFIEKRRKKNAAKDHRYMPYRRSANSEQQS
ncbi:hypothetical protein POTOM_004437 [Populus tomentosa]|uniref:rRNA biogenesis protein RRP36 n=1 Tax=Populus tomentosa TaxID=118781 RepID=A0A8X8AKJ8_POPTO|nr:hypothetical protein POTOM_004437 [Populus tomentosa]